MSLQNQKNRILNKNVQRKNKKGYKFVLKFNRFFIKKKSFNFYQKLIQNKLKKRNLILMFFYIYNLNSATSNLYLKKLKSFHAKTNFAAVKSLDFRLDVILLKLIFFNKISISQKLIYSGFVRWNGRLQQKLIICNLFDTVWLLLKSKLKCFFCTWSIRQIYVDQRFNGLRKKSLRQIRYLLKFNSYVECDYFSNKLIIVGNSKTFNNVQINSLKGWHLKNFLNIAFRNSIKNLYLLY